MILATRAPAKVNLVLRVGPPRADGYHEISSLMVPLDLCDGVRVEVARGRRGDVTCRCPGRPELDGEANLAARAALAFRRRFELDDAVAIRVEKRIPVTAGLGGGSSDAAAVLRCLARAYRVRDREALIEVAAEVGSDVPFFLGPGPAWAAGRGERLRPAAVPPLTLVLAYPPDPALAIRAADAYRWLDEGRGSRAVARPRPGGSGPFRVEQLANDLQAACVARFPRLATLLERLVGEGATRAIMSGSGPTVFGAFTDRKVARKAARALSARRAGGGELQIFIAGTRQRHPGVSQWKSPRSASSRSRRRSSRRT